MKRIIVLLIIVIVVARLKAEVYTSIKDGSWSISTNWSPVGIPGIKDSIIVKTKVIYSGNFNIGIEWNSFMLLEIDKGGILEVDGSLVELSGTGDKIDNRGTLIVKGSFSDNQNTVLINSGNIYITGGDINFNQSAIEVNTGLIKLVGGNFNINQQTSFANRGTVIVDNTGYTNKTVSFNNLNYSSDILLSEGSQFNIISSSIVMTGYNTLLLDGSINLTDGNLTQSFGNIIIGNKGVLNTLDTDNNGDGILILNGGGGIITNNGISYIQSISTSGGSYTITDNNFMFIANLAIGTFDDGNNSLNVSSAGKLYYCGNPIRQEIGKGILGTVTSGGKIYYSTETNSYPLTKPNTDLGIGKPEKDFSVADIDQITLVSQGLSVCLDAYKYRLSSPLSIELNDFSLKKINEGVELRWSTKSETNNDFFSILRSYNEEEFETIKYINGQGTTTLAHDYTYIDKTPYLGINYYRLEQTDFDGKSTYSDIRSIDYYMNEDIVVYPNPSDGTITIETSLKEYSVTIFNLSGIIVYNDFFKSSGKVEIQLEVKSGIYQIVLNFRKKEIRKILIIE